MYKRIAILYFLLFIIICSPDVASRSVRYVKLDSALTEAIERVVIPYGQDASGGGKLMLMMSTLSHERDDYKYLSHFIPEEFLDKKNSEPVFVFMLSHTGHLRKPTVEIFDPTAYTIVGDTYVFIKDVPASYMTPTGHGRYNIVHYENYCDYDPHCVSLTKIDGSYRLLSSASTLSYCESSIPANAQAYKNFVELPAVIVSDELYARLPRYRDRGMCTLLSESKGDSVAAVCLPQRFVTAERLDDCVAVFMGSAVGSPIYMTRALADRLNLTSTTIYNAPVNSTPPAYTSYFYFPAYHIPLAELTVRE